MSECKLDHSLEDVRKKLEDMAAFVPARLYEDLAAFLTDSIDQLTLNEVFHLLKKYDLSSAEERSRRDQQLDLLLTLN